MTKALASAAAPARGFVQQTVRRTRHGFEATLSDINRAALSETKASREIRYRADDIYGAMFNIEAQSEIHLLFANVRHPTCSVGANPAFLS